MKNDFSTIQVQIQEAVAVLTMNNPPVNQLSPHFSQELGQAVASAWEDPEIKGIVLTGTGKNFIAGADITEIQKVKTKEEILPRALEAARFINAMEAGPKPIVAAINGNALGGGLEVAMGCHYRLAVGGVNVGLPEVQIGVIPGGGGTQRLPRLVGLPNALEMITTGQPIKSEKAQLRGLIDEIVDPGELIPSAVKMALNLSRGSLKSRMTANQLTRLPSAAEKTAIIDFARAMTGAKAKGYIAPFKAIEAMDKGLSYDMVADIDREVDLFCDCAISDVAKNLIGIFLNTRAAGRLPGIKNLTPAPIKKAAMLGGGVMGSGIVHLFLNAGFRVWLWDVNEQALAKGVAAIRKTYDFALKKNKMKPADLDRLLADNLIATTKLEDLGEVDLVVEAVLEDMRIKKDIWKKLEGICRPDVVFGTNTSALPITEMAAALQDPGRMIGLHFFNPAHRMQLLEIIRGKQTSDQTLATSVALGRIIKKVPIVVNDGPGFYVSRQLGGLMGGSVYLVASGVDGAAIELAMMDFGMPMGPATLADLTGIDINYHVNRTFEREMGERYKVHPLTEVIYQTGCYGRKTGAGYFDYSGPQPVPNPKVAAAVAGWLQENGVARREMPQREIIDSMLALAINEAALMIEEGICDRPQDMDLAMIYGTGFPPYRGGILRYADKWGLANVVAALTEMEKAYGLRFRPAGLLEKMAEAGESFYKD